MQDLANMGGVYSTINDLCAYGLQVSPDGPSRKPTRFLSDDTDVLHYLQKQCAGDHEHIRLESGLPKAAQKYPDGLIDAIISGLCQSLRAKAEREKGTSCMCLANDDEDVSTSAGDSVGDSDTESMDLHIDE